MRKELRAECDYVREANCQRVFKRTVGNDPFFYVPDVVADLSSSHVLTSEFVRGTSLEHAVALPQTTRDMLARQILRLCLQELFVWRLMQTDPNWSNFLYDHATTRLNLIDFGALREYPDQFVNSYQRLVVAAANGDRRVLLEESVSLGFLTGSESRSMLDAHCDAGMIGAALTPAALARASSNLFVHPKPFSFSNFLLSFFSRRAVQGRWQIRFQEQRHDQARQRAGHHHAEGAPDAAAEGSVLSAPQAERCIPHLHQARRLHSLQVPPCAARVLVRCNAAAGRDMLLQIVDESKLPRG
jgi:hypothetical protein